jgi:transcriptional regulator with XRE-family HTH domain
MPKHVRTRWDIQLGRRLREFRLAGGRTQTETARVIGSSYQMLQKIENGACRLSARDAIKLATFLKIDLYEFFGLPSGGDRGPSR